MGKLPKVSIPPQPPIRITPRMTMDRLNSLMEEMKENKVSEITIVAGSGEELQISYKKAKK